MQSEKRSVVVQRQGDNVEQAVEAALVQSGVLDRIDNSTRVVLKPNLTYPFFKRGVTTSPRLVEAVARLVKTRARSVAIVECDGGYGAWKAEEAFEGHGLYDVGRRLGVEVVSLHAGEKRPLKFQAGGRNHQLMMPVRLLDETELLITMPVPKIHCMTGLTLAHKNQWGCVPDDMRLRRHYIFNEAIVAINAALMPAVLADGTYFLDGNGPMDGEPVKMDLVIAASDVGSFDRYVSELMGWSYKQVPHLRHAVACGGMPAFLDEIEFNEPPSVFHTRTFRLKRTVRNWIALSGFRSRTMTWFGYESWFGREVLHRILYAIAGKPPKPRPEASD